MLGYTNLGMPSDDPEQQSGVFEPEPPFERIEPILGALERAMRDFEADAPLPAPDELAALTREEQIRMIRAALGGDSVVRRVVESQRAVDAFALHLRDEQDREVPTQFIAIHRLPDDVAGAPNFANDAATCGGARFVLVARLVERSAP